MFTVIRKSVKMALKNKNIAKGQILDIFLLGKQILAGAKDWPIIIN